MNISYDNDIKLDDGFVILSQEIVHSFGTLHMCDLCEGTRFDAEGTGEQHCDGCQGSTI